MVVFKFILSWGSGWDSTKLWNMNFQADPASPMIYQPDRPDHDKFRPSTLVPSPHPTPDHNSILQAAQPALHARLVNNLSL